MSQHALQQPIEDLWERRETLSSSTKGAARDAVEAALDALDAGQVRVAEKHEAGWQVNQWLKKAVLMSFRLTDSEPMDGPGGAPVWDKVPMKFAGWGENRFKEAGFRAVPGAVVRRSAFIAPGAVLMPSFVNVGARVGRNTMVDTWATVGTCAELRRRRRGGGAQPHGQSRGHGGKLCTDGRELPLFGRRRHRRRSRAIA